MLPYWKTCFKAFNVVDKESVNRLSNIVLSPKKLILQWAIFFFFCQTRAKLLLCQLLGSIGRYLVYCLLMSFLKLPGILQAHFLLFFSIFLLDENKQYHRWFDFSSCLGFIYASQPAFGILRFKGSKSSEKCSHLTITVSQTIIMIVSQVGK